MIRFLIWQIQENQLKNILKREFNKVILTILNKQTKNSLSVGKQALNIDEKIYYLK